MLRTPRIPEIAQRDRFIRSVAHTRMVHVVATTEGVCTLPSPSGGPHRVAPLWSTAADARRWLPRLHPGDIAALPISVLIEDILPHLALGHTRIGPDWTSAQVMSEHEAGDFAHRLREGLIDAFCAAFRISRTIWILEDASGPVLFTTSTHALALPCWSDRDAAEAHRSGAWAAAAALPVPWEGFLRLTLPWIASQGWRVALAAKSDLHGPDLAPEVLAARLDGARA